MCLSEFPQTEGQGVSWQKMSETVVNIIEAKSVVVAPTPAIPAGVTPAIASVGGDVPMGGAR